MMQYTALGSDLGPVFKQQHCITRVYRGNADEESQFRSNGRAFMNRLALSPSDQIRLPKLDGIEPGTPSHRYHPRPTDLTRMIVNWVCRKPSAGSEIRLAYRESMIALSIIKSRSCDSKLNSVRVIILRPAVLVVLAGLEAKPAEGWTNHASQKSLPKDSGWRLYGHPASNRLNG